MDANWEPKTTLFNKKLITVDRGQIVYGRKVYSERLGISEAKLRRYCDLLKLEGMINQQITSRYSLLTVLNYDQYQDKSQPIASQSPANNQPIATSKQVNNKTSKSTRFIAPSIQEVTDYCQERGNFIIPINFIDHYETNGWMRGKTKIRDWKACIRTWEKNHNPEESQTRSLEL